MAALEKVDSPVRDVVLLYDGLCGFCDRTVQFALKHDRARVLHFAALQGQYARDVLARHPGLQGIDSLVLVERDAQGERVSVRSEGALRLAGYLDWPWRAAGIFKLVPRVVSDWCYDAFARIRYRVFGKFDACPLPSPETRARFID